MPLRGFALFISLLFLVVCSLAGFAQSPFGVDLPSTPPVTSGEGAWGAFLRFIAEQQSAFYQAITQTISQMKADGTALWALVGFSFVYGVFHAAGPGHGKIVMSSYVLANRETVRRGIVLCFLSSLLQAFVAVFVIFVLRIILDATSLTITNTARFLEIGSYTIITGLGLYLLWRVLKRQIFVRLRNKAPQTPEACGCGYAHAPTPEQVSQKDIRSAIMAVVSVGLRPCSGALIVLSFALAQGLFWQGVAAVFAMGFGTALTVSTLMFLAVSARGITYTFAGRSALWVDRVSILIQLAGASFVVLFGFALLSASLRALS